MLFYIDDKRQPENHFWNSVHGVVSEQQIMMLLDGIKITIGGIGGVTRHTVAAHVERFKRRFRVLVVMPQITELCAGHQHQLAIACKRRKHLAREFPLVVLQHMIAL